VAFSTVANYAFGHLEIGMHRALMGLADQAGDRDTRTLAEFILAQELEMAAWREAHLFAIAAEVLLRAAAMYDVLRPPTGGMVPPLSLQRQEL
jgi:ferritin-like metal-binding protein YciE